MVHSLHVSFEFSRPLGKDISTVDPPGDNNVRMMIVVDHQTNGTVMTGAQIVEDDLVANLSWRNLENSKRFTVLMDKIFVLPIGPMIKGGDATVSNYSVGSSMTGVFKFNKEFKTPLKMNTSGTTDLVGVMTENSFHIMVGHDAIGATQPEVFISYNARIRFTD